ncbi:unnamed protein product [Ceutorhynchus assimilis]|uniref:Calponin-homology (CH) domain-containing protein n=1 Tax=Ceutorhynchus assimilis TaxID=467358 RepID=A0A9N9MQN8_9CUCU|nr:unnamed protein product [Ceutorhynchus assimilis]
MFFQISPVVHKKPKPIPKIKIEDYESQIEVLSLALFTTNPKIVFENVTVGTVQTKKLLIKNPTGQDINLFVKKSIPEEMNFLLSWNEAELPKGSEKMMELVWSPVEVVACRYTFTLSDGKRTNRDIGVTFKSVMPKQLKGTKGKKTTKPSSVKLSLTRKPISPTKKLRGHKISPKIKSAMKFFSPPEPQRFDRGLRQKRVEINNYSQNTHQKSAWEHEKMYLNAQQKNKENLSPFNNHSLLHDSHTFISPTNVSFLMQNANVNERRETYIVGQNNDKMIEKLSSESFFFESKESSLHFNDSLDSPNLPLRELNSTNTNTTPSLEDMLKRKVVRRSSSPNYGYNFAQVLSKDSFAPSIFSILSKPPSTDNSLETLLKSPKELFNNLNQSSETYIKSNTSFETYIKENSTPESYVAGNISSGTYIKDNSIGNIGQLLEVSPLSSRSCRASSPIFSKPSPKNTFLHSTQNLSCIAEESSLFNDSSRNGTKRKSSIYYNSPIKRDRLSGQCWSKTDHSAIRVARRTSGLNLRQFNNDINEPLSSITEKTIKTVIVKNPFLYANIFDPFMTSQVYCDEEWIEQQENNFKKWLNTLLMPPEELNTAKIEVNVAHIWHECTKKNAVPEASSKEVISLKYHTNKKLDYLRKQAQTLFRSQEMSKVLQKVCLVVETGKLSIRDDKDIHLNLKLKSDITRLILGYNPLWLRLGLETIFNEIIPLKSNTDINGLANFILERFFKNPYLVKKHKTIYASKYSPDLKKFLLKKFLMLVFFLDTAKNAKLIQHDPCLFCKNAVEKESKLVLTYFARETLQSVGDITKYLKGFGYKVTHAQSYIHEYDYAVKNLGSDLRDGVRLARVMEIIQMRSDLTGKLRVPAISRLQKIHNMQLVFQSLQETGYEIQYEIEAKHIVDGIREKTLSFLWQIIYKFEAPLMVKSAKTIQTWFRSYPVQLKRQELRRVRYERENAAKKIQGWFRRQKLSRIFFYLVEVVRVFIQERKEYFIKLRNMAAVIIQKNSRKYICRKQFLLKKAAVVTIQRRYRAKKLTQKAKNDYGKLKMATINVQRRFRANIEMKTCRQQYLLKKSAAKKIQSTFRMYTLRKRYLQLQKATTVIQQRYRSHKLTQNARNYYANLKIATVNVQRRFRANMEMKNCRQQYLLKKSAAKKIQSTFRMYTLRKRYLQLQKATTVIQQRYRSHKLTQNARNYYANLKIATVNVQRRFRANMEMKNCRQQYLLKKSAAIKIQTIFRMYISKIKYAKLKKAALVIQQKYRAQIAMKKQRAYFVALLQATIFIQQRIRSNKLTKQVQQQYLIMRQTTITIQSYFRMRIVRKQFLVLKKVTIYIQTTYRAKKAMEIQKTNYQCLKKAALVIQQRWRARQLAIQQKSDYNQLRKAAINIQQRFRANKLMLKQRKAFVTLKHATIIIQRKFRARKQQHEYHKLQSAAIFIQQKYRAKRCMQKQVIEYQQLRNACLVIQQRWRARQMCIQEKSNYNKLKQATIKIQQRLRANKLMLEQKHAFAQIKNASMVIQQRFRANKLMQQQRRHYLEVKSATVKIQIWYKSILAMRTCRKHYVLQKKAVAKIEQRYIEYRTMLKVRYSYINLHVATETIQKHFRALILMKKCRRTFLELKSCTIIIQQKYRAQKLMQKEQASYKKLKMATIFVQSTYRTNKLRREFLAKKNSAIKIQKWYRAVIEMRKCRAHYQSLKLAAVAISARYKATKLMQFERNNYKNLIHATVTIQRRFKCLLLTRKLRQNYLELKNAAIVIQRKFRATIEARKQEQAYKKLKAATIIIQRRWRANLTAKNTRKEYLEIRRATFTIQRFGRGYLIRTRYAALLTPEARDQRRILRIQNNAAKKIQAYWRGYYVRKSNVSVIDALKKRQQQRFSELGAPGQGKTLIQRCEAAMLCLTGGNASVDMLISALQDLDFISRHCQKLCCQLSQSLPWQLYTIITAAARSLPEMKASNVSSYILINFYKYPKTRQNSWDPTQMDRVLNVLVNWCDKDSPLFPTLCTLLWLFAHEAEYKKVLLALPNFQLRLAKISTLVMRKQNMVEKSHKLQLHSCFGSVKHLKVPSTTATWGLDYKRPNMFTNSVFALTHLMNIFDL